MSIYTSYFFAQEGEAEEYLDLLDEYGPEAVLVLVVMEPGETSDQPHYGSRDELHHVRGGYIISVNRSLPYIGVERVTEG